jgi:hypothetical protein
MKKILRDIFIAVVGLVIGSFIYDYIKGVHLITGIKSLLEYPISLWVVIIIITLLYLILRIINKPRKRITKRPEFPFLGYTKDKFGAHQSWWCWQYEWNYLDKKYEIVNLFPKCPNCKNPMFEYDGGRTASCPKCRLEQRRYNFDVDEYRSDVHTEIIRRIKSSEFST